MQPLPSLFFSTHNHSHLWWNFGWLPVAVLAAASAAATAIVLFSLASPHQMVLIAGFLAEDPDPTPVRSEWLPPKEVVDEVFATMRATEIPAEFQQAKRLQDLLEVFSTTLCQDLADLVALYPCLVDLPVMKAHPSNSAAFSQYIDSVKEKRATLASDRPDRPPAGLNDAAVAEAFTRSSQRIRGVARDVQDVPRQVATQLAPEFEHIRSLIEEVLARPSGATASSVNVDSGSDGPQSVPVPGDEAPEVLRRLKSDNVRLPDISLLATCHNVWTLYRKGSHGLPALASLQGMTVGGRSWKTYLGFTPSQEQKIRAFSLLVETKASARHGSRTLDEKVAEVLDELESQRIHQLGKMSLYKFMARLLKGVA